MLGFSLSKRSTHTTENAAWFLNYPLSDLFREKDTAR